MKKYYSVLLVILFGLGVWFYGRSFLPAVRIHNTPIHYQEFNKVLSAFERSRDIEKDATLQGKDLVREVLQMMIENALVAELINRADPQLENEARKRADEALLAGGTGNFSQATNALYGLSAEDIKELDLVPRARREVIFEYYRSNPERMTDELRKLYQDIRVHIYISGYYWQDGEVKKK